MKKLKFYVCPHCGNVVIKLVDKDVPVVCCGEKMLELKPNTTEAVQEKHLPVVSADGDVVTIRVGEVEHPMTNEHYISHIIVVTNQGYTVKTLKPTDKPVCTVVLNKGEKIKNVYSYCNLHSLWGK